MEINEAEEIFEEILSVVSSWPDFTNQAKVCFDLQKYIGDLHLSAKILDQNVSKR